ELLLGPQLHAEVGELALATLAMLAGSVFAAIDGALGAAPDILTHAAIKLMLGLNSLCHFASSLRACARRRNRLIMLLFWGSRPPLRQPCRGRQVLRLKRRLKTTGRETLCGPPRPA